ncbi:hypothetical protein HPP92_003608 [Vanilla planifolia]|uniref:SP-RING-type domain-containing protein n=1 Tax=Vanilla planifolia TaxID=51239 RepID=A0A835S8P6_VANPL|nr:hypothetical protein HPP92_003608 [Vanilla planifolia]
MDVVKDARDLVDRIATLLSDQNVSESHVLSRRSLIGIKEIVKIIDDTYRKIQGSGATLLASRSMISSDFNFVKPKAEVGDACQLALKVRCPCGSSLVTDSMIKCEDGKCQVWQHLGCVMLPQKPLESGQLERPPIFYCELCRLSRADPFCVAVRHPVLPLKLTNYRVAERTEVNVEKTFTLSRADKELLQRTDYDLQVWCILLNDEVYFRMHWPLHSKLKVNGFEIKTTNRDGSLFLGINSRDDGQSLKTYAVEGINKIFLSGSDDRVFCCGIRLVRRQTVEQILSMIPRESEGESLKDSLARVHRCILGGKTTENSDSDSDIEVVADSVTVSLRDPMSGSRIRIAGRFKGCVHMRCFDLETFIIVNQRSRKVLFLEAPFVISLTISTLVFFISRNFFHPSFSVAVPTCLKNYSLESILIDPYFNRITSLMQHCGEDVNEVELRPDGCWRAKTQGECNYNDLCGWHFPDGSLCGQTCGETSTSEMSMQLKQVGSSEGFTRLKFDLRRKNNGMWEIGKMDQSPSSGNNVQQESESNCQKIMHVRSNVTGSGSYRALEDISVNGTKLFDFPSNACNEIVSINETFGQRFPSEDGPILAQPRDENVIVISDSDEEDKGLNVAVPNPCLTAMNLLTSNPSISGDLKLPNYGTFTSDFVNRTNDLGSPLWEMQLNPEDLQFLHSDISISDALVDAPGPGRHCHNRCLQNHD